MSGAAVAGAARLVLAAALSFAAIQKLRAGSATRVPTAALVGEDLGTPIAAALPFVELAIAVLLLVWWSPVAGIAAVVLLASFTVVLIRAEVRHLPCPCFGGGAAGRAVGPAAVVRNGVLLACAVLATGSPNGARPAAVLVVTIVLGAIVATAIWFAR